MNYSELWALLADPLFPATVILVLVMGMMSVLLISAFSRDRRMTARLAQIESALHTAREGRKEDEAALDKSRAELMGNLRGMGDSVARAMGQANQLQQAQWDALGAQLREARLLEERRQEDMRRALEGRIEEIGTQIGARLSTSGAQIDALCASVDVHMQSIQADSARRLAEMRTSMDDQMGTTLGRRLDERFSLVSARLEQVYQGLGEMRALAGGVDELSRVLTGVRARGLVGVVQLGTLLSQIMAPAQYDAHVRVRPDGDPVDYAIKLPGRAGECDAVMPIDASFKQDLYHNLLDALDAGDRTGAEALGARLAEAIDAHAAHMAEQFINPPSTTPFAVLFLPIEGLYAEALRAPGLPDHLQRTYGVTLAGPATLTALLNSLQMGLRGMALEKQSTEVWALLDAVRGEFMQFADALVRTQNRLREASESIEDATRASQTLEKQLRRVQKPELPGEADARARGSEGGWDGRASD